MLNKKLYSKLSAMQKLNINGLDDTLGVILSGGQTTLVSATNADAQTPRVSLGNLPQHKPAANFTICWRMRPQSVTNQGVVWADWTWGTGATNNARITVANLGTGALLRRLFVSLPNGAGVDNVVNTSFYTTSDVMFEDVNMTVALRHDASKTLALASGTVPFWDMFINGAKDKCILLSGGGAAAYNATSTSTYELGRWLNRPAGNNLPGGNIIWDFCIFGVVLTDAEIAAWDAGADITRGLISQWSFNGHFRDRCGIQDASPLPNALQGPRFAVAYPIPLRFNGSKNALKLLVAGHSNVYCSNNDNIIQFGGALRSEIQQQLLHRFAVPVQFVGDLTAESTAPVPWFLDVGAHSGRSGDWWVGNGSNDLNGRRNPMLATLPDAIIMVCGGNDIVGGRTAVQTDGNLDAFLTNLYTASTPNLGPTVPLLIDSEAQSSLDATTCNQYNALLAARTATHRALGRAVFTTAGGTANGSRGGWSMQDPQSHQSDRTHLMKGEHGNRAHDLAVALYDILKTA